MLYTLCLLGFISALHYSIPIYTNSSFLGTFFSEKNLGLLYSLSSLSIIIGLLLTHWMFRHFKTYSAVMTFILVQFFVTYGIALVTGTADVPGTSSLINGLVGTHAPLIIGILFVLNTILGTLIGFVIDIIVEANSTHATTGIVRGIFLTAFNFGWIVAPIIGTSLVGESNNYPLVYVASAIMLIPLAYILRKNFRHFHDSRYTELSVSKTLRSILIHPDLRKIFGANIILNIFYAWMVIYTPIYLHTNLGFAWDDIGVILTFALLPFILFEIPLGKLADKKLGEKELMTLGFIITAGATMALPFIPSTVFWWSTLLFITRVGASTAELMLEIYFFKKIALKDMTELSLYRTTRQIAFIVTPFIVGACLMFTDTASSFLILGFITLLATFLSMGIKDTK